MATLSAQSQAASLFEKAQSGINMLASIDSQIGDLLSQRREVQTELTQVQSLINTEFGRLMRESDELPAKVLAEISGTSRNSSSSVTIDSKNVDEHPEAATRVVGEAALR